MEIQGLLILPVGYQEGTRYPTLLHIHGGPWAPGRAISFAGWHDWGQFMAQRGYAVLMPNPRGSSGRGTEFLCAITNCYGEAGLAGPDQRHRPPDRPRASPTRTSSSSAAGAAAAS